jgi:hypothetical protein
MTAAQTTKAFAGLSKLPKTKVEKKKEEKVPGVVTNKVGDSRVVSGVTEKWDGTKWVPEKKAAAAEQALISSDASSPTAVADGQSTEQRQPAAIG